MQPVSAREGIWVGSLKLDLRCPHMRIHGQSQFDIAGDDEQTWVAFDLDRAEMASWASRGVEVVSDAKICNRPGRTSALASSAASGTHQALAGD